MITKLRELLQTIVNEPEEQKLNAAAHLLVDCVDICKAKMEEKEAYETVLDFLAASLASNGSFSSKEDAFIRKLFGDDVDLFGIVKDVDETTYEKANAFVDGLGGEEKAKFVLRAVYVLAADDNIDATEIEYLEELMG